MNFTNDFFIQAQGCIERVFRSRRQEIIKHHGNIKEDIKSNNTVVTELDMAVERDLRSALEKFDPSIGIEGEEFGVSGSRETYWLIDPIDGTEEFVRGLPFVRNMATLIDQKQPVFTVVYKPIDDEVFVAAKGEGAYLNGAKIKVSNRPSGRAWVEFATDFAGPDKAELAHLLSQKILNLRRLNDFPSVASGKLDGLVCVNGGGGTWDYAPRALLIKEAGGMVANFGSDSYDINNKSFVMANPVIFNDLMDVVKNYNS